MRVVALAGLFRSGGWILVRPIAAAGAWQIIFQPACARVLARRDPRVRLCARATLSIPHY